MAISDITKPMALDETLQDTNTALGLLAKDATVSAISTALGLLGKDTSIQAVVTALGLLNKDTTMVTQNSKLDTIIAKLQGIIEALGVDTSIYKAAGNKACADLTSSLLVAGNLGNVYNITDNGTTTADFVEGAGKPIHLGDNVAVVDIGEGGSHVYKFDLLSGLVDLSNYIQKSETAGLLKNDGTVDTKDYAEKVAGATNGNLAGLNGSGNLTDSGWNGAKDTTSISGNPISISGLKANQLAVNPIITLEPIQAGSGTPSPSNIRAISGYDKIEVLSCGKNLFDISKVLVGTVSNGVWNVPHSTSTAYEFKFKPNTAYTFSGSEKEATTGSNVRLQIHYTDDTLENIFSDTGTTETAFVKTSDANKSIADIKVRYTTSGSVNISNFQIEEGNVASPVYEPYHKTTDLSESLGQTVYWGELDVRSGKFKVVGAIKDMGDMTWSYDSGYSRFLTSDLSSVIEKPAAARTQRLWFSCYECVTDGRSMAEVTNGQAYSGATGAVYAHDDRYTDGTAFKTAVTGQKIVYPLATPTEIQLTPHEISLLKDYAYVSTNGTTIALDYHNGELASLGDVSQLGETVNELEEYIQRTPKRIMQIDITLYNATNRRFDIPCDGYITLVSGSSASGYLRVYIYDNDNNTLSYLFINADSGDLRNGIFVKRGMRAMVTSTMDNGVVYFRGLE